VSLLVGVLSGWTLWHEVAIYAAAGPNHLGGPTYAASAHRTEADCHAGQRAALADEERFRRGPLSERLPDGVQVWDVSRHHFTTFRYRCAPTGAHPQPVPPSR
jgi:hypothetical protein